MGSSPAAVNARSSGCSKRSRIVDLLRTGADNLAFF